MLFFNFRTTFLHLQVYGNTKNSWFFTTVWAQARVFTVKGMCQWVLLILELLLSSYKSMGMQKKQKQDNCLCFSTVWVYARGVTIRARVKELSVILELLFSTYKSIGMQEQMKQVNCRSSSGQFKLQLILTVKLLKLMYKTRCTCPPTVIKLFLYIFFISVNMCSF